MHQPEITLADLAARKLLAQFAMHHVVLGHDEQAAGVLVEPVDDSRTQIAARLGQFGEAIEQRIDQRSPIARIVSGARPGMHHHARRLVDDGQIAVLVNHIERNVFGHGPQRRRLHLADDFDVLAALELE